MRSRADAALGVTRRRAVGPSHDKLSPSSSNGSIFLPTRRCSSQRRYPTSTRLMIADPTWHVHFYRMGIVSEILVADRDSAAPTTRLLVAPEDDGAGGIDARATPGRATRHVDPIVRRILLERWVPPRPRCARATVPLVRDTRGGTPRICARPPPTTPRASRSVRLTPTPRPPRRSGRTRRRTRFVRA